MILVSKTFFRALVGTNLDPEIRIFRKSRNPDFWIRMNQEGSEKKITYCNMYMNYHFFFTKIFVRPLLLGAPLVNLSKSTID